MSYISAEGLPVNSSQINVTSNSVPTNGLVINSNSVQIAAGSTNTDLYLGSLGDATQLTLAPSLVTSNTNFEVSNGTQSVFITANSVEAVGTGNVLNLGSPGDTTQIVLSPGLVNCNTPFEVTNGTQAVLINTNSVEAVGTGNVLNLGSPGDATQLVLSPGLVNCNTPFEVTNNGTIVSLGTQNDGISVLSSTSTILELNVAPTTGSAPEPVIAVDAAVITTYAPIYPSIATYLPIQPIAGQYPVGYTNQPTSGSINISLTGGIKTIGTITPPSVGVWLVTATIASQSTTQDEVYLSLSGTNGTFYSPSVVSSPVSSQLININTNLLSTCVFSVTSAAPNVYILATSFDNNASTSVKGYSYTITRIA